MLVHLRIRDFAIIDALELDLERGFTVVTGETGAGKSILIDALSVVLGGRASASELVRSGCDTAEVEALFDISDNPLVKARLEQRDLLGDDPDSLLIRRVIGVKGRAKVLVNGRLATAVTLAEIVRNLVEISGQHEQQSLLAVEHHLEMLDAFGHLDALKSAYAQAYGEVTQLRQERKRLLRGVDEALQRGDFLRFQMAEITKIAPNVGEDLALTAERKRLVNAEKLRHGAMSAEAILYGDDDSVAQRLGRAATEVESLARVDPSLRAVADALSGARREVDEAARTLQRYSSHLDSDPERLTAVDDRLADIQRLCRKHGGSVEHVLERHQQMQQELANLDHQDQRLQSIDQALWASQQRLREHAAALSNARVQAASLFDRAVRTEVAEMELADAQFCTCIVTRPWPEDGSAADCSPSGMDDVEFMWSANAGEAPRPLAKIASGGELSRLMLAIKGVLRHRDLVSLYIFDEVDAGLGGKAADSIGRKIQRVGEGHQALAITHLAPIAARAHHHLHVRKEGRDGRTVSVIQTVTGEARAEEIARMIDGAQITRATRQAARAMLAR